MSQHKRKPSPAKKIAILTFYWILELLPFFVFGTNPALTNRLNGVEKAAWLFWKKLQAELRWPPATFPVRVTSATACWAFYWEENEPSPQQGWSSPPTPVPLFCFFFFWNICGFPSASGVYLLGQMKAIPYGVFNSSVRSWYYFCSHTIKIYFITLTTLFVLARKSLSIPNEYRQTSAHIDNSSLTWYRQATRFMHLCL